MHSTLHRFAVATVATLSYAAFTASAQVPVPPRPVPPSTQPAPAVAPPVPIQLKPRLQLPPAPVGPIPVSLHDVIVANEVRKAAAASCDHLATNYVGDLAVSGFVRDCRGEIEKVLTHVQPAKK